MNIRSQKPSRQRIFVISMDGLHGSGKGTQIELLQNYLRERGIPTLVRRGDGIRGGAGEGLNDPVSAWWQENEMRLRLAGIEGEASMRAATEATNRLNREIYAARHYFMPKLLAKEGQDTGVILLDRGLVSRLFVKRREESTADFEAVRHFYSTRGRQEVVLPDITFLFQAPLEVLVARNEAREATPVKKELRRKVLADYYGDFEEAVETLPYELKRGLVRVDATRSIQQIHETVISQTMNLIEGGGGLVEFERSNTERKG